MKLIVIKELYDLWNDAKELDLSDGHYNWMWTDVDVILFEDHIVLEICERISDMIRYDMIY